MKKVQEILERANINGILSYDELLDLGLIEDDNPVFNNEIEEKISDELDGYQIYLQDVRKNKVLTDEEFNELFIRYKRGDNKAREKLILSNLFLVIFLAKKMHSSHKNTIYNIMDLIQEGNVGLIIALEKFDINNGSKFATYAYYWVLQSMVRFIIKKGYAIKYSVAKDHELRELRKFRDEYLALNGIEANDELLMTKFNITNAELMLIKQFEPYLLSFDSANAEIENINIYDYIKEENISIEQMIEEELICEDVLKYAKENLDERSYEIFKLKNGIENNEVGACEPKFFEDIGKYYGISAERVRQIERRSEKKLQKYYKDKFH